MKAIVVGHDLGGLNLALAMDLFPYKISVGVFLSAFMPDTIHQPLYLLDKDQAMSIELQRWMINNNPPKAVLEIKGAEHMPMFFKTKQLCDVLMREKEFEIEGLKKRTDTEKREKRNQRS
ncbi:putative methylesterase 6 [Gossypium hirsutum]|uniref:Methylesterase 6 n=1 Tax=Gossypium hirsutum TaxID=3635 RepID=A0A1U8MT92_GOSHI|nr:putative methylesterase 6 [Gossypium hirsutum]